MIMILWIASGSVVALSPGSSQFFNVARRKTGKPGKIHHVNESDVEGRLHNFSARRFKLAKLCLPSTSFT